LWDVTDLANKIIDLLSSKQKLSHTSTLRQLVRILRGLSSKEEKLTGIPQLPGFGCSVTIHPETGKDIRLKEEELKRMIILLIAGGYLSEDFVYPNGRNTRSYIKVDSFNAKTKKINRTKS